MFNNDEENVPWNVPKQQKSRKFALIGVACVAAVCAIVAILLFANASSGLVVEVGEEELARQEEHSAPGGTDEESAEIAVSLWVHVAGEVVKPGLYELASGARVDDAIKAAGGFSSKADSSSVNLAESVQDGQQIFVYSKEESSGAGSEAAGSKASSPTGKVNINTATSEMLQTLPGIGEATAAKILADREDNGKYKSIEDIKRVRGIGDKKFEELKALICV